MNSKIQLFFLYLAVALMAVSTAWADGLTLQDDGNGGYYVNMPANETATVSVPEGVTSFKVYDDGGKDGNASYSANGVLTLSAPEGCIIMLVGDVADNTGVYLDAYDGTDVSSAQILEEKQGPIEGEVFSSGQNMTLRFRTGGYSTTGMDLSVSVFAVSDYAVNIASVEGGSLSGPSSAKPGERVTLTVAPSNGYLLAGVEVKGAGENLLNVDMVSSFSSEVSFVMQGSDVTVTPVWTNTLTVDGGIFAKMLAMGTESIAIPEGVSSFKVYDDGGKEGAYHKKEEGTLVLTAPEGYVIQVSGSIYTEAGYDKMTIYNGNTEADMFLHQESGQIENIGVFTSTGRILTIYFESDGSVVDEGLDLSVSVLAVSDYAVSIASVEGGSLSDRTSAKTGEVVTLTVAPSEGYLLAGVEVKDAEENLVNVNMASSFVSEVSFIMPGSDVTVIPVWTNTWTAAGGVFAKMPATGTESLVIPEGVSSLKVYDDGGKDGHYDILANGVLVLTVSAGHSLQLDGSIDCNHNTDYLNVYDGADTTSAVKLLSNQTSSIEESVFGTKQSMAFHFHSKTNAASSGLDLTVSIIESVEYSVTITSVDGGTMTPSVTSAKPGDLVTLTASPSEGYLLFGVNVTAGETPLGVTEGKWYSENVASFIMPPSDVVITPTWTNALSAEGGLEVNMPANGARTIAVPEGVTSFKVYDDGGKDRKASLQANGILVLSVPEGHIIMLDGDVYNNTHVYLDVYDGTDINSTQILKEQQTSLESAVFSSGANMTIRFRTGGYETKGIDLTVSVHKISDYVVNIASVEGGSVSGPSSAKPSELVTLTATPSEGYLLAGIKVQGAGENLWNVNMTSSFSNEVSFLMQGSDVTVTPIWKNTLTADDGIFVNMPASGTETIALPKGMTSFKVYDDGGKDRPYHSNSEGSLVLTAPKNHVIMVSGRMDTETGYDKLTIYDGNTEANTLLNEGSGEMNSIGSLVSSGRTLTICFNSDGSVVKDGLDLTVTVIANQTNYAAVSILEDAGHHKIAIVDGAYSGTDAINIPADIVVDKVIFNRKFSMYGRSTIVLPFDINAANVDGWAEVFAFDHMEVPDEGLPYVVVSHVWCKAEYGGVCATLSGNLTANTPYFVTMVDESLVIHEPEDGVTIRQTTDAVVNSEGWSFIGTFQKKTWPKGDAELERGVYGYSAEDKGDVSIGDFVKVSAGSWIRPLRAYLLAPKASLAPRYNYFAPTTASVVKGELPERIDIVIDDSVENGGKGGEENTTVIGHINTRTGEIHLLNRTNRTFDLKGRSISGKPRAKGIYLKK